MWCINVRCSSAVKYPAIIFKGGDAYAFVRQKRESSELIDGVGNPPLRTFSPNTSIRNLVLLL